MNALLATAGVTAMSIVTGLGLYTKPESLAEVPVSSLCATYTGPAFIGPDESRNAVAVHAGEYPGISFVSLDTGRTEAQFAVPQRFFAAAMPRHGDILTLAVSENSGIRITSFDVTSRGATSTRLFGKLSADLSAFTPNGINFLGVTNTGDVFRIDIKTNKLALLKGAGAKAQAIAISEDGALLYIAGKGIAIIDIDHLSVISTLTRENLLLGIAVSPDKRMLAARNWHSLELLDAASGSILGEPFVVDAAPDAVSASSVNIAFSPDGSQLFYARASNSDSELFSFSVRPLQIVKRSKVSPYSSAMAILPGRQWVLVTAGAPGKEQIEAFDMKTLALIFKTALPGRYSSGMNSRQNGCVRHSHSG